MRIIVLLVLLLPSIAVSEPASIRSGEHDTFTRLVISVPAESDFSLLEIESGYVLSIDSFDDGFVTEGVFARIPRDRIADLVVLPSGDLALEVECKCRARTFKWQDDRLVVDIIDDPNAPLREAALQPSEISLVRANAVTSAGLVLPDLLSVDTPSNIFPADAPLLQEDSSTDLVERIISEESSADLLETELALIAGLTRAASQGLLETPEEIKALDEEIHQDELDHDVSEEVMIEPQVIPQPGIGISTAIDRDLELVGEAIERTIAKECLSSETYLIRDWADDRDFHEQTASLITALASEFGQEPIVAQENLARLYIYFGFGAEARLVLASSNASSQTRQVLVELSGLVDDEVGRFPITMAQAGCDTHGGLWAFLLQPSRLETDQKRQVLQNYFALPQPLRSQLAPRFSRAFIQTGDHVSAERVLAATENRDFEFSHEAVVTHALLADEMGDEKTALAVLAEEADDSARVRPETLIRLIDLAIEQRGSPSSEELLLAAALRQEYRHTDSALDLANAEARGRISRNEFQEALDLVISRREPESRGIVDFTFRELAKNAPTEEFLAFVFGETPDDLTSPTENIIADRLLELGFPERADMFLSGSAVQEAARERRILRARSAMNQRDFLTAIELLIGLDDERAQSIRAESLAALGEHSAALSEMGQAISSDVEATLQFRANAWEGLNLQEDPVLSSFAETVLGNQELRPTETLADRRAILDQSQSSRRSIEELLDRFVVSDIEN